MNDFRLVVVDHLGKTCRYSPVDIVIDGERLIDVLKRIETPFAEAEGSPALAGNYHSLSLRTTLLPSRRFLEDTRPISGHHDRRAILVCACGCEGCWDFVCRITFAETTVTWSDFEQINRSWDYLELGTLVFDRRSYEKEFSQLPPNYSDD